jgi:hypothetical protein
MYREKGCRKSGLLQNYYTKKLCFSLYIFFGFLKWSLYFLHFLIWCFFHFVSFHFFTNWSLDIFFLFLFNFFLGLIVWDKDFNLIKKLFIILKKLGFSLLLHYSYPPLFKNKKFYLLILFFFWLNDFYCFFPFQFHFNILLILIWSS